MGRWLIENFPQAGLLAYSEELQLDGTSKFVGSKLELTATDVDKVNKTGQKTQLLSHVYNDKQYLFVPAELMPYSGATATHTLSTHSGHNCIDIDVAICVYPIQRG